jgi:hypothetical protein
MKLCCVLTRSCPRSSSCPSAISFLATPFSMSYCSWGFFLSVLPMNWPMFFSWIGLLAILCRLGLGRAVGDLWTGIGGWAQDGKKWWKSYIFKICTSFKNPLQVPSIHRIYAYSLVSPDTSPSPLHWRVSRRFLSLILLLSTAHKSTGAFKTERLLLSLQGMEIRVEGQSQSLLNFCSNNYLGLSSYPALAQAGRELFYFSPFSCPSATSFLATPFIMSL